MRSLSAGARALSPETNRPDGRLTDQMVGPILADISRLMWPAKTAANVATVVGCTERAAERYLAGDREWSGDAIAALISEILKRHKMRNVRVKARV